MNLSRTFIGRCPAVTIGSVFMGPESVAKTQRAGKLKLGNLLCHSDPSKPFINRDLGVVYLGAQ